MRIVFKNLTLTQNLSQHQIMNLLRKLKEQSESLIVDDCWCLEE